MKHSPGVKSEKILSHTKLYIPFISVSYVKQKTLLILKNKQLTITTHRIAPKELSPDDR